MKKILLISVVLMGILSAEENIRALQYDGVAVSIGKKKFFIERERPDECTQIAMTPKNLFGANMVDEKAVNAKCIKKISSTLGAIQPIQIDPKIKTVAELEVLSFIKKEQKNPRTYILVDARKSPWFERLTIPTAINIPYNEVAHDKDFPEDHKRLLNLLKIKQTKSGYDFSHAKTALVFCNGSWCVQSLRAIKALLKLGYPKEKLLWYRGGLQDWIGLGFPAIKP